MASVLQASISFGDLPNELVLSIAGCLPSARDELSLVLTAGRYACLLQPHLVATHAFTPSHSTRSGFCEAAEFYSPDCMRMFLRLGGSLLSDELKLEGLYWACFRDRKEIVQLFLDAGADPNTPPASHPNTTPFWIAVHCKNSEIMQLLLDAGADLETTDDLGRTVLRYAVDSHWGGSTSVVVRFLLDAGADIFATDNDGYTPEEYALEMLSPSWHGVRDINRMLYEARIQRNARFSVSSSPASG